MNILSTLKLRAGVSAAVFAIATISNACYAQVGGAQVRVVVPFNFENGSQHLAAGTYMLKVSGNVLKLSGDRDSGNALATPDVNVMVPDKSRVIFKKYGDKYFLREVWVAGSTLRFHLPVAKVEKQMQIAQNQSATKAPEVALLETSR